MVSSGSRSVATSKNIFGGGALWLLAPTSVFIVVSFLFRGSDPDLWWHLASGEYIVSNGIPRTDPFSFTASGAPWVLHEWLAEVFFYFTATHLGFMWLSLLMGACGALALVLLFMAARLAGGEVIFSFFIAALGISISSVVAGVRPQIFTILLLCAQYVILLVHDTPNPNWRSPKFVWLLLPLMCLWANLHGGYIIGCVVMGLWCVQHRCRSSVVVPVIAATVATVFTPNGISGWWYPFTYAGSGNASMVFLQEWQSPNFHQLVYSPLLLAILAVASVGVVGVFPGALGFCYSLSTLLFLALSLRSARHAPLFGVSIVPILATALVTRFPRIAGLAARYSPRIVGGVITLAVAVSISVAPKVSKVAPQTGYRPSDGTLPRQSIEYLRSKDSAPLFNEYAWGGYCLYSLFPKWKVFIDGRADVHGDAAMHRYHDVWSAKAGWEGVLDAFQIRYLLVAPESPLAASMSQNERWKKVVENSNEVLFERD